MYDKLPQAFEFDIQRVTVLLTIVSLVFRRPPVEEFPLTYFNVDL